MLFRLLFLLGCLSALTASAQEEELYFFCNKDSSKIGVRSKSRVIIPAQFNALSASCGDKVATRLLTLMGNRDEIQNDSLHYNNVFRVYNRKGKFLYSPYLFDNGPDYFHEGVRRFVEGQKMGLVDRFGNKVIPAIYNYILPFYRGYALACVDCKYVRYSNDEDHCCHIAGTRYQLLDRSGKLVKTFHAPSGLWMSDSLYHASVTPSLLSPQEKSIIHTLQVDPKVKRALNDLKSEHGTIYPVVAERPSATSPYYLINFRTEAVDYDLTYVISKDGKTIRQLTDDGEEVKPD